MTGPEHYAKGEELLEYADACEQRLTNEPEERARGVVEIASIRQEAQVHFIAAQVAATMDLVGATVNGNVSTGWKEVLS